MAAAPQEMRLPVEYGLALEGALRHGPDSLPAIRNILDKINEATDVIPSRFGKDDFDLSYVRFPLRYVANGSIEAPTESNSTDPVPRRLVLFMTGMGLPNRPLRETALASAYNLVFEEIGNINKAASNAEPVPETEIFMVGSTTNEESEVPVDLPDRLWDGKFSVHGEQIGHLAAKILPPTEEERANTEIVIVTFSMAAFKGRESAKEIASRFPETEENIELRYLNPPDLDTRASERNPFLNLKTYLVAGGFVGDTVVQKMISRLRSEAVRTKHFLSELPRMPERLNERSDSQFWTKFWGNVTDGANIFRDGLLLQPGSQRFPTTVEFGTRDLVSSSSRMRRETRRSGSFEHEGVVFKARPGGHKDQPRVGQWLEAIGYAA